MSDFEQKDDISLDSILDTPNGVKSTRKTTQPKTDSEEFELPTSHTDEHDQFEDMSFEDHRLGNILDHPPGSVKLKHLESKIRAFLENIVQGEGEAIANEPMKFPAIDVTGNAAVGGSIFQGETTKLIVMPRGGTYYNFISSVTGQIRIQFNSGSSLRAMLSMIVQVYTYVANESILCYLSGYTYPPDAAWWNTTAEVIGRKQPVRFCVESNGNYSIRIGDITSVWSYPSVFVHNVGVGYGSSTLDVTTDIVSIDITTSAPASISRLHSGLRRVRYIRDYINGSTANIGNHWVEISATDVNGNNVAYGKTVTAGSGGANLTYVTDGSVYPYTDYGSATGGTLNYVQVDLGEIKDIYAITVWHYYGDNRTYYDKKTQISEDGVTWETIYDQSVDGDYQETVTGHRIVLAMDGVVVSKNDTRHYVQFPQMADPTKAGLPGVWQNISVLYAGDFFRAEGGDALAFNGGRQLDQMQRIYGTMSDGTFGTTAAHPHESGALILWSNSGRAGRSRGGGYSWNIRVDSLSSPNSRASSTTDGETRSVNRTIRIWERIA